MQHWLDSRTTNGTATKMLAKTMPGKPKTILKPRPLSTNPNNPAYPYSRINATLMMTGDTAKGRSTMPVARSFHGTCRALT